MQTEYTAIIKQEGDWWIGWIEEVPGVNCQERTRQELIETLRMTLKEAIIRSGYPRLVDNTADFAAYRS